MPICNYGVRWAWERSGWGRTSLRGKLVNFADQIGIYLLYHKDTCVYVGRACRGEGTIGSRLYAHKRSPDKVWDSFTWFGFRNVGDDGELELALESVRSYEDDIRDMEAVLIYLLSPEHNLRAGDHRHLVHHEQLETDPL
jgi:hypothetical protein